MGTDLLNLVEAWLIGVLGQAFLDALGRLSLDGCLLILRLLISFRLGLVILRPIINIAYLRVTSELVRFEDITRRPEELAVFAARLLLRLLLAGPLDAEFFARSG